MQRPEEEQLIRDIEDWNSSAAEKFKRCIEIAKYWRRCANFQGGSDDVFSNVMNNSGCNAELQDSLSGNPGLLRRAQNCLNFYKNR